MTQPPTNQPSPSPTPGTLYDICWNEVFPPLILVRALRVSVMARVLGLAMVGVVLTGLGWSWLDQLFETGAARLTPLVDRLSEQEKLPVQNQINLFRHKPPESTPKIAPIQSTTTPPGQPQIESTSNPIPETESGENEKSTPPPHASTATALGGTETKKVLARQVPSWIEEVAGWTHGKDPLTCAWSWLSEPLVRSASSASSWRQSLVLMASGIWAIMVWALFGGAITRIAALHLTRGETPGPLESLKESFQKWGTLIGAPIIPLIGSSLLALPLALAGFMLRSEMMTLVIGLSWIFVILWGFLLAIILVGLLIGWPLMWATVGVERTDAFDGVSRCYAYVYQRPMHLMLYLAIAIGLGWLGQIVVTYFAMASLSLGEWAVSWGAGRAHMTTLMAPGPSSDPAGVAVALPEGVTGMVASGAAGIRFWKATLQLFVAAYAVAYLWSATVGIYLLLRKQVDATEMDEIVIEEPMGDALPLLQADASGIPDVEAPAL